jgi:hypothetical protein
VTLGEGFTVTVIVNGAPVHELAVDVGVTIYCTVPAVEPGLVNVWLIGEPDPAVAPVMPPVMVPIVQEKLLATPAVKLIFVVTPEQIVAVAALVTAGAGFTVTVIVNVAPTQEPVVAVGVTLYCTVPAAVLLGLVSTWLMEEPEAALAPVMPPVIVPIVQLNVLGALAVKLIFGPVPLQVLAVAELVTAGVGFTAIVAVLLVDITLVQISGVAPDARFVMVTVVEPAFAKAPVVKVPVPAVVTVMDVVRPVPALGADKL